MRNITVFPVATVLLCCLSLGQPKGATWKEYSFPEDGFAIVLPHAPRIHPDVNIPDTTAYSVNIDPEHAFTVRVRREPRTCDSVLSQLRESVRSSKVQGSNPASLKDVEVNGHPGLEYEWDVSDARVGLERYYCGESRIYILAVN